MGRKEVMDGVLFRGNWATLIIPWQSDGTVDLVALKEEIGILIESKVNGIYSCGTAGEFHLLLEDEFIEINRILSEECHKRDFPFQIGASHFNPHQSLERINNVKAFRPSAIQVIAPDWWFASADVVIRFLNKAAEKTGNAIPFVLYNPPHAKKVYKAEEIAYIKAAVPMLKGIKISSVDKDWYQSMKKSPDTSNLSVFIPGHTLATGVRLGAHGSYSNVCCISPGKTQSWTDSVMRNEWDSALEIERRLNTFMKEAVVPFIDAGTPNYLMDRAMAVAGGWGPVNERCRWPYQGLSGDDIDIIRRKGKAIIPEFFQ